MGEEMTRHVLKCHPTPFQATWDGQKSFEIRKFDRAFVVGDEIVLREWDPQKEDYAGRNWTSEITYISTGWGLPEGLCVLGIKNQSEAELARVTAEAARVKERFKDALHESMQDALNRDRIPRAQLEAEAGAMRAVLESTLSWADEGSSLHRKVVAALSSTAGTQILEALREANTALVRARAYVADMDAHSTFSSMWRPAVGVLEVIGSALAKLAAVPGVG